LGAREPGNPQCPGQSTRAENKIEKNCVEGTRRPRKTNEAKKKTAASSLSGDQNIRPSAKYGLKE
jgi:hypothetical protein